MASRTDITYRRAADIDRATRLNSRAELPWGWLARVNSSTLISGTTARYLYAWVEATFAGTTPYAPAVKTGGIAGNALSVSELSNGTTVSYGVVAANIPVGYAPKPIPNNTYVWVVPFRASNGGEIYLIVNTQAIDGICP